MQHDNLRIEVDGTALEDLDCDLVSLEVELDDQLAGMFRMTLALLLNADGSWTHLDEAKFAIWRPVKVTAGVQDDTRELFSGFITHLRPEFGTGMEQCRLAVWAMDRSVLMDRVDKLKDWPNKKDSDIVTETFLSYGLTPQVTDTKVIHEEEGSTIIQRETDIQLLKRLALRNGFECFVDGTTGYFRPPALKEPPQPVLAVQFGKDTNVNRFSLEVNALAPANVEMFQQNRQDSGEILHATAATGQQKALGAKPPASFLASGMKPAVVYIGQTIATGKQEMDELCRGLCDQGEWFVTGEGEVSANQYGSILMPRGTVTIKGIGEAYSGVYYVTHVTHRFTPEGYTQAFRVKRNALMPTGKENFGGGGLLAGLAGAL